MDGSGDTCPIETPEIVCDTKLRHKLHVNQQPVDINILGNKN